MSSLKRNNVIVRGKGSTPMMFAHGFGCDQNMWRFVAPAFEETYQTVLFDHVGAGGSDLAAYSYEKYNTLEGYAEDIIEVAHELRLKDAVFVGHSVSVMMGIIVAAKAPGLFQLLFPAMRYGVQQQHGRALAPDQQAGGSVSFHHLNVLARSP